MSVCRGGAGTAAAAVAAVDNTFLLLSGALLLLLLLPPPPHHHQRLVNAFAQLLLVAAILVSGALYMRHHVATLPRADHSGSEWLEDSQAGNGTRYRVVTAAASNGGSSFTMDVVVRSTAPAYLPDLPGSGPEHSHRQAAEHLAVSSGRLGYKLLLRGRETTGVLAAGEMLDIPAGPSCGCVCVRQGCWCDCCSKAAASVCPVALPCRTHHPPTQPHTPLLNRTRQAGTSHMLYNADNTTDVAYTLTHRPAGRMGEVFFENLAGGCVG